MAKQISKQASAKVSAVPALLKLLQSWLWYNDRYKLFFSTRHTNNPQEYWFFILDIDAGARTHGRYRLTTDAVIVELFRVEYTVKDLATMRVYDIIMIQLTNTKNELNYYNWLAIPLPVEKGKPYTITSKTK